jgi:homoserine dehydrogenase
MRMVRMAFLGCGNVGRALAVLLEQKRVELADRYGVSWKLTGVASRSLGWVAAPDGLDGQAVGQGQADRLAGSACTDLESWLECSQAEVLFEMTSLNPASGQPALEYLRNALECEVHVVTANKGPVVYGYHQLSQLADAKRRRFLFESTVMDGAPVFSLFRQALPAARLLRFRGVLNSTTNFVLGEIETGLTLEAAVQRAQDMGIAETDPSADLDGWDATVKVCALATVLMDSPLLPDQVQRTGIRGLEPERIRAARREGRPFKLACQAERGQAGLQAWVAPEQVAADDPLFGVRGTSSLLHVETDVLSGLTIVEHDPGPHTTAYGMLADFLEIVRHGAG